MKVIKMINKIPNIKKNNEKELSKMVELIHVNKDIETGHLIHQSMKYHYPNINDWTKYKIKTSKKRKPSENPTIESGKQLDEYLNKSISKRKEDGKNWSVQHELFDWIETTYNPTVFMTIQLPEHLKTENIEVAKERFRSILSYFERQLLGRRWTKYHLKFVCFLEGGISGCWHAHILYNQAKFKPWHLWLAVDNTLKYFDWSDYCIHLDIINANKTPVIKYCFKEVKVDINGHFDSSRFCLSDELFDKPKH